MANPPDSHVEDPAIKKFFISLALDDIINEAPLHELDKKYGVSKSFLQSLQNSSAAFASMVASFCNKLGWNNIELLLNHLQSRLEFGVQQELLDLMRLPCLNSKTARLLYDASLDTVKQIAHSPLERISKAISSGRAYITNSPDNVNRKARDKIWVEAKKEFMPFNDFASLIQNEAREIIERDTGAHINWDVNLSQTTINSSAETSSKTPNKRKRSSKNNKSHLYSLKSPESKLGGTIHNASKSINLGEYSICPDPITPNASPVPCKVKQVTSVVPEEMSVQESSQTKPGEQKSDTSSIPEMFSDDDFICLGISPPKKVEKEDDEELAHVSSSDESSSDVDKRHLSGSIDTSSLHVKKKVRHNTSPSISEEQPSFISPGDKVRLIHCSSCTDDIINKWLSWKRVSIHFGLSDVNQPSTVIGQNMGAPLPSPLDSEVISFDGKKLEYVFLSFGDKNVYCFKQVHAVNALANSIEFILQRAHNLEIIVENIMKAYKILRLALKLSSDSLRKLSWLDIRIASWLEEPENRPQFPKDYISRYMNEFRSTYQEYCKKSEDDLMAFSTSLMVHIFSKIYQTVLLPGEMLFVYKEIEMKAALIFAESQLHGFHVDRKYLQDLHLQLIVLEDELKEKAFTIANSKFNLSSPKQVAEILYFKLDLLSKASEIIDTNPVRIKKIKEERKLPDHLRTAKNVLEKLIRYHELPKVILDYRSVENVKSNVIVPINSFARGDTVTGKLDLFTATGRVSMGEPDLMKTPKAFSVLNDRVINVRKILTAKPGYTLISADYSQLEMRILAHLCKDVQLIDSLNSGTDVFRELAARIAGGFPENITEEKRQQAKGICYGIIYGMGNKTLSERLGVTEDEALDIKNAFLETLQNVRPFIDHTIEKCKQNRHTHPPCGRRRYLPHISSSNSDQVSRAGRQAINSTIQGSAADLAKLAMVKVDEAIQEAKINAHLTLEMHDELIYQVKCESLYAFSTILSKCMQQVTHDSFPDFEVKLPVNLKTGPNWGEMSALDPVAVSQATTNQ